ncbi:hypothetical protein D3C72_1210160 [compost metagenome]
MGVRCAAMQCHYRTDDRQPQSAGMAAGTAGGIGTIEAVEQFVQMRRGDRRALIDNQYRQPTIGLTDSLQLYLTVFIGIAYRVGDQVTQCALKQHGIRHPLPFSLADQRNAAFFRQTFEVVSHPLQLLRHIKPLRVQHRLPFAGARQK